MAEGNLEVPSPGPHRCLLCLTIACAEALGFEALVVRGVKFVEVDDGIERRLVV